MEIRITETTLSTSNIYFFFKFIRALEKIYRNNAEEMKNKLTGVSTCICIVRAKLITFLFSSFILASDEAIPGTY